MNTEKSRSFFNKNNFLFFKSILWICTGLLFLGLSIVIPASAYSTIKEIIIFLCLVVVVNFHTTYLYPIISKKNKFLYFIFLTVSIFFCAVLEIIFLNKNINDVYFFLDKRKIYLVILVYIFIRDLALFVFFFWIEYFNRTLLLYKEKEKIHKQELALLIEKQEFEKKFSRKKLLPHYFFNILEHIQVESLANNNNYELMSKLKFILYYFLVDAEKEHVELDKELAFYNYYIELENFRHQKNISVSFNVLGQPENFMIIPLLFEPLIGNAMKYTKRDGSGWVDITIDAQHFPILTFYCRNNFSQNQTGIISSDSGLKIFEQRLGLCYNNKHALKITQTDDLYEITLTLEVD